MTLLVAIAALVLLRLAPAGLQTGPLALLALVAALLAGLTFPDADLWLPLDHRSAVTHSALAPLLLALRRWARPVAAGLALGIGLHLSADFFPEAMTSFATIKVPGAGSIGSGWSWTWIGANAALCGGLGAFWADRAVRNPLQRLVVVAAVVFFGFSYLIAVDGGWFALIFLLAAGWIAARGRTFAAIGFGPRRSKLR